MELDSTQRLVPDFQRFRRVALCEGEPDRVPLVELEVEREIQELFLGRKVETMADEVGFWAEAGYDYIPIAAGMVTMMIPAWQSSSPIIERIKAFLWNPMETVYSTNRDDERKRFWHQENQAVITDMEAFKKFEWPNADEFTLDHLEEAARAMPDGMKIIPVIGVVFQAANILMGLETFFKAIYDEPDLVAQMCQIIGEIDTKVIARALEYDFVGALWMSDDLAYSQDLMVAPKFYRRHIFPWYQKWAGMAKSKGLPVIFHSDGRLNKVIPDLIQCGINALHPNERNSTDIRENKRLYGGRLAFFGNLDLSRELTMGTPQEVEEVTKGLIRDLAPGGGYGIGSSNSVTEFVPVANYRAMRDATLKYGRYPISIP
jgi:uroporphyrinogen decarboxylase